MNPLAGYLTGEKLAQASELNAVQPYLPELAPLNPLCQKGHAPVQRAGWVYCSRLGCANNNTPLYKAPPPPKPKPTAGDAA